MKKLCKRTIKKQIISKIGVIPSIFEDEFYSSKIIKDFKNRHDLLWSLNILNYDGDIIIKECFFKFKKTETYIYLKKRDDENTFSIKVFFDQKNLDSIRFLISSIKEHKTI